MDPTAIKRVTALIKNGTCLSPVDEDRIIACLVAGWDSPQIIERLRNPPYQSLSMPEKRMIRLLEIVYRIAVYLRRTGHGPSDTYYEAIKSDEFHQRPAFLRLSTEDQAMIKQLSMMLSCLGLGSSIQKWCAGLSEVSHHSQESWEKRMIRAIYKLENELFRCEITHLRRDPEVKHLTRAMRHVMAAERGVFPEDRIKSRNLFGEGDYSEPDLKKRRANRYKKLRDHAKEFWPDPYSSIPSRRTEIQSLLKAYHAGRDPATAPMYSPSILAMDIQTPMPTQQPVQIAFTADLPSVTTYSQIEGNIKSEFQEEVRLSEVAAVDEPQHIPLDVEPEDVEMNDWIDGILNDPGNISVPTSLDWNPTASWVIDSIDMMLPPSFHGPETGPFTAANYFQAWNSFSIPDASHVELPFMGTNFGFDPTPCVLELDGCTPEMMGQCRCDSCLGWSLQHA